MASGLPSPVKHFTSSRVWGRTNSKPDEGLMTSDDLLFRLTFCSLCVLGSEARERAPAMAATLLRSLRDGTAQWDSGRHPDPHDFFCELVHAQAGVPMQAHDAGVDALCEALFQGLGDTADDDLRESLLVCCYLGLRDPLQVGAFAHATLSEVDRARRRLDERVRAILDDALEGEPTMSSDLVRLSRWLRRCDALTLDRICEQLHQQGVDVRPRLCHAHRLHRRQHTPPRHDAMAEALYAVSGGRLVLTDPTAVRLLCPASERVKEVTVRVDTDLAAVRAAAKDVAARAGLPEERTREAVLCSSEAASNTLKHAGGGRVGFYLEGSRLRIKVTDGGPGIDLERLPRCTLMRGWSSQVSLGLGFKLLLDLMGRVWLSTGPRGTTLVMEPAGAP